MHGSTPQMAGKCEDLETAISAGKTVQRGYTGVEEVDFLSDRFGDMLIRMQQQLDEKHVHCFVRNGALCCEIRKKLSAFNRVSRQCPKRLRLIFQKMM